MDKKVFKLVHSQAKQGAIACINSPDYDGFVLTLQPPCRSLDQNSKLHACLSEISRQVKFQGGKLSSDDTKRLLLDAFCRVRQAEGNPLSNSGRLVPSLDGSGVVQLGLQSRSLSRADASEFIEYLIAWGVDQGVKFSDYE